MPVLDSILADNLLDTMRSSVLRGAPDEDLKARAEAMLGDEAQAWRWMSRCLAELSPSVIRQGDFAALRVRRMPGWSVPGRS